MSIFQYFWTFLHPLVTCQCGMKIPNSNFGYFIDIILLLKAYRVLWVKKFVRSWIMKCAIAGWKFKDALSVISIRVELSVQKRRENDSETVPTVRSKTANIIKQPLHHCSMCVWFCTFCRAHKNIRNI